MKTINGYVILWLIMLIIYLTIIMKCSQKDNHRSLLKSFVWESMDRLGLVSASIRNLIQIFMHWIMFLLYKVLSLSWVGILVLLLLALLFNYLLGGSY